MTAISCTKMGLFPLIILISLFALSNGVRSKLTMSSFEENLQKSLQKPNYRLNLTVYPSKYTLHMRPVLDDGFPPLKRFTSPSSVSIQLESISSANTITLHQRGLEIDQDNVKVTYLKTGEDLTISSQSFEVERDLYEIKLEVSFELGDLLEIFIPYSVNLSQTTNVGIYLGHYEDPLTNETRYLSTTKLEPYHARKVFPLFDEPWIKSTFEISVGRLDGKYHSLSNMEIVETEQDLEYEGWVWDHYAETVLMSPYLVCMIVSDFAKAFVLDEKNRTISAWAPKHDIDRDGGAYGAITGEKILNYFEKKFKMDYALPKLDAVALPQFASGAMENFGLVTYRYGYLVWIPGENTEADRRKVTQVLAHEIAHQWFGNIVTCAWWSDLWLNEGFARFLQSWGMQETLPEFMMEEAFVNDVTQLAMAYDQGPLTHPVKNSAQSPNESTSVFDRISYEKGASLLRMMEWFLTKPVFEFGIIDIYLQRMKWSSAFQDDLFEAIQDAVELHNMTQLLPSVTDIKSIMDSWTLQSGYPLLRIGIIDHETISISQEKFTLNFTNKWGIDSEADDEESSWWIPVKVVTFNEDESDKLPDSWIPKGTSSITYSRHGLNTSDLVMVNPDALGYYRVLYDDMLAELIKETLLSDDYSRISSSSRSQLLDDYFNLANASYIQIEEALEMTDYLGKETSSNVWTAALTHLKPILNRFTQNQEALTAFKKFYMPRLESALSSIGVRQMAGERGINVTLRAQLLEMGCQLEMQSCYDYADDLMTQWELRPEMNPFPVDIQSPLYCAASEVGGADNGHWDFIFERFEEAKKDPQRTSLMNALACSKNLTILSNLLEMALTSLGESSVQIMSRVVMNPEGRSLAYEFVKSNLVEGKVYPNEFASVVSNLSGYWDRQEHIEELEQFIEANGNVLEPVKDLLTASLANIQRNIDWWNSFGSRIQLWLETQLEDWFIIV